MPQTDQISPWPTTYSTGPKCTWAAHSNIDNIALPAFRGAICFSAKQNCMDLSPQITWRYFKLSYSVYPNCAASAQLDILYDRHGIARIKALMVPQTYLKWTL